MKKQHSRLTDSPTACDERLKRTAQISPLCNQGYAISVVHFFRLECFLFFVWFLFIAAFDIQNAMLALALAPEVGRTDESKILVCRRRTRYDSMIKSGPC